MVRAVDANVVFHGRGELGQDELVTVPEVMDEIRSSMGKFKADSLNLRSVQPSGESVEKVERKSREINSPTSEADERLVALAMDRGIKLMSDDRALQNLALHLDVEFEGFLDNAVEEKREWKMVCENCGREVDSPPCSCGSSSLRRKPR
jgi:UPF0271 protein